MVIKSLTYGIDFLSQRLLFVLPIMFEFHPHKTITFV